MVDDTPALETHSLLAAAVWGCVCLLVWVVAFFAMLFFKAETIALIVMWALGLLLLVASGTQMVRFIRHHLRAPPEGPL